MVEEGGVQVGGEVQCGGYCVRMCMCECAHV